MIALLCLVKFQTFNTKQLPVNIEADSSTHTVLFISSSLSKNKISLQGSKTSTDLFGYDGRKHSFHFENISNIFISKTDFNDKNDIISYWTLPKTMCQSKIMNYMSNSIVLWNSSLEEKSDLNPGYENDVCVFFGYDDYDVLLQYGIDYGKSYIVKSTGEAIECSIKDCAYLNKNEPFFIRFVDSGTKTNIMKKNKIHIRGKFLNEPKIFNEVIEEVPDEVQGETLPIILNKETSLLADILFGCLFIFVAGLLFCCKNMLICCGCIQVAQNADNQIARESLVGNDSEVPLQTTTTYRPQRTTTSQPQRTTISQPQRNTAYQPQYTDENGFPRSDYSIRRQQQPSSQAQSRPQPQTQTQSQSQSMYTPIVTSGDPPMAYGETITPGDLIPPDPYASNTKYTENPVDNNPYQSANPAEDW